MRTDILDFYEFYQSPIGRTTKSFISTHLQQAWANGNKLSIAGFGYANPYLPLFSGAESCVSLSPGAQGVIHWPSRATNAASLVGERRWPFKDASFDRILIIHGLEETPEPRQLLREAWRVLRDDGRLIIVASHRRGLWSIIETTPFAAGRPYLKHQLNSVLKTTAFRATHWSAALYYPPLKTKLLLRAASAWERAGARLWSGVSGVIMVEAQKDLMAPAGLVRSANARLAGPVIATAEPARRSMTPRTKPSE